MTCIMHRITSEPLSAGRTVKAEFPNHLWTGKLFTYTHSHFTHKHTSHAMRSAGRLGSDELNYIQTLVICSPHHRNATRLVESVSLYLADNIPLCRTLVDVRSG